MPLIPNLKNTVTNLYALASKLGAVEYRVTIVRTSGVHDGMNNAGLTTTETLITFGDGYPEVKPISQKDFILGASPDATWKVGPIPPRNSNLGGFTPEELGGNPNGNSETEYVVTAPGYSTVKCRKDYLDTSDPLAYYLYLKNI